VSRVVVHIDRLVVAGPADRRAVEAAVREAVARELSRPGAVDRTVAAGNRETVDAGRIRSDAGPVALGTAIGRSLTNGGTR
jgi:hypothetical protein